MSGLLVYPGTPRSRKRRTSRGLLVLGLAILLCVATGYLLAPLKRPSPEASEALSREELPKVDAALRQSEFCTNNCNSSDIYRRLWYEARVRENARTFRPRAAADDPYRDSIETNLVTKDFRIVIKVLAFNRLESLRRCLRSLAKADYGGDRVDIHVFVDHVRVENSARASPEPSGVRRRLLWSLFKRATGEVVNASEIQAPVVAPSAVDARPEALSEDLPRRDLVSAHLSEAHSILEFVDAFWWRHGAKEVHYRSQNAGLQAQWIEAWWPADLDEFAFVVEDDVEVSNLYYRFLRAVVATYYYNPEQFDPSVYGISLQRPRLVPGRGGHRLNVTSATNLFLYPLVGTWGQLLFPKQWKEFRVWYDERKSIGERPFLDGMVTNSWYQKLGERIWTPWFVKFVHSRGYLNLHTNFGAETALSVSHREPGSNYRHAAGPDSQLLDTKVAGNDTALWVMSPSRSLPQFDFCFRPVKRWEVVRAAPALRSMLAAMAMNQSVILVNAIDVDSALVRNWVCHMERLGLRKFLLVGKDEEMISDLARRGYGALSAQLFDVTGLQRDVIAVQAVHGILKRGYSVWLTRADSVWVENPLDTGSANGEVMASHLLDASHPALLYIKASQRALRMWSKWVGNVTGDANTRNPGVWAGLQSFITTNNSCRYSALPLTFSGSFRNLKPRSKVVLFNGVQGRNVPFVVHTLKAAGLWAIDQDLACKRVYC